MKWALVLSGGGGRGLSYIGLLKALEDMGYPRPGLIAGCSIGALIGGIYASGTSPDRMKEILLGDFEFKQYLTMASFSLPENRLTKVIQMGESLTNLLRKQGAESGEKILEFIRTMTGNINFEQTHIPFICNATELTSGKEHIFKTGNIAEAIRASISFPGVFEPVEIGDKVYVDGYITHNTPVWAARGEGYSNVLAVYIDKFRIKQKEDLQNGFDILMRAMDIAAVGKISRPQDIATASLIVPDKYTSYDFGHIEERIENGYNMTKQAQELLDQFFEGKPLSGYLKRRKLHKQESAV